jgi:hypothetical protein
MNTKKPNAELVWKQLEDLLVPRLRLSVIDRTVYAHLLRHTRLEGKLRLQFSIMWLARNISLSTGTASTANAFTASAAPHPPSTASTTSCRRRTRAPAPTAISSPVAWNAMSRKAKSPPPIFFAASSASAASPPPNSPPASAPPTPSPPASSALPFLSLIPSPLLSCGTANPGCRLRHVTQPTLAMFSQVPPKLPTPMLPSPSQVLFLQFYSLLIFISCSATCKHPKIQRP